MPRLTRLTPPLVLVLLSLPLAACGTRPADGAPETPDDLPGAAAAAERARAQGVAPALVHVTEAPGFTLAEQSVGVLGDDDFGSVYVSGSGGRQLSLTARRGWLDAASCPNLPLASGAGTSTSTPGVRCERDGDLWYRTSDTRHEYARATDGVIVQLTAERDVADRDVLRDAARNARHVRTDVTSGAPTGPATTPAEPAGPVERGDLPPHGDGAPLDGVGAGG